MSPALLALAAEAGRTTATKHKRRTKPGIVDAYAVWLSVRAAAIRSVPPEFPQLTPGQLRELKRAFDTGYHEILCDAPVTVVRHVTADCKEVTP